MRRVNAGAKVGQPEKLIRASTACLQAVHRQRMIWLNWVDWAARCCRAILVFALCEFVNLAGFAILLVLCGLLFVYTMGQPENSRMAVALAV